MLILLAAAACVVAAIVLPIWGVRRAICAALLTSLTIAPARLLGGGSPDEQYLVGISYPAPAVATFTILLPLATIVALARPEARRQAALVVPFLLYVAAGTAGFWQGSGPLVSGAAQVGLIALAWIAGTGLAPVMRSEFGVKLILVLVTILAGSVLLQVVQGVGAEDYGSRASGLFGHPATVGKLALPLTAMLLPQTEASSGRARRLAYAGIVMCVAMTMPTQSRANISGILLLVLGWVVINRTKDGRGRRYGIALVAAIAAAPYIPVVITRFVRDPEGGERPELLAAGLREFAAARWTGLGPNNFVPTAQAREIIVAVTGYPVHNAFVLALAELGLIGCFLALVPLGYALIKAIGGMRLRAGHVAEARALVLLVAAVALVSWSGWGTLRYPVGQLIAFACAVLATGVPSLREQRDRITASRTSVPHEQDALRGGPSGAHRTVPRDESRGEAAEPHHTARGALSA
ncbi:O-antigen ligase family protein [Cellulomonas palmilytica]|uniref:O-antigen ligase family protein n=1 Tax=Cellulomonas palmilytica TaxID=2608402 RepID=UPI001F471DBD|nr:O-antigen ligase family protein [Cellulomonas palmilytica]UJP41009.1 hypothetical protein F1D97_05995 [Cellulomonas palmilytica]